MLLTTRDVALLLRVHPKHVYRLLKRGLPARRVGDEWRFDRDEVLAWSCRDRSSSAAEPAALLAANGDVVIDLLLEALARRRTFVGLIRTDHRGGVDHLRERRVLAAGIHEHGTLPELGTPLARLHLVEREIGIVFRRGARVRRLSSIVGRRLALRPESAGIRARFEAALALDGLDVSELLTTARNYDSHRDVVLSILRGDTEIGITTAAWAERAGLGFLPIASEPYGLLFRADTLGDARAARLCELCQERSFRKDLEAAGGYRTSQAGRIRVAA